MFYKTGYNNWVTFVGIDRYNIMYFHKRRGGVSKSDFLGCKSNQWGVNKRTRKSARWTASWQKIPLCSYICGESFGVLEGIRVWLLSLRWIDTKHGYWTIDALVVFCIIWMQFRGFLSGYCSEATFLVWDRDDATL